MISIFQPHTPALVAKLGYNFLQQVVLVNFINNTIHWIRAQGFGVCCLLYSYNKFPLDSCAINHILEGSFIYSAKN